MITDTIYSCLTLIVSQVKAHQIPPGVLYRPLNTGINLEIAPTGCRRCGCHVSKMMEWNYAIFELLAFG